MRKLLLLCIVSLSLLSGCKQQPTSLVQPVVQSLPSPMANATLHISQTLLSPEETIEEQDIPIQATESALDVLKRTHTVETKHFDFGDIADTIDGTQGGAEGRYWIFYVNGKMSQIGASEYKPKDGDQIIWKFQKENEGL